MTEEQRKEYERLSDKKYSRVYSLTRDEESMFKALKRIKEHDMREEQKRLRVSALSKLGLTEEEFQALFGR